MDWLSSIPAILTGLAVLVLPGFATTLALRLRIFDAIAVAPPVSIAIIGLTATAASATGVPWNPWTVGVASAIVAGLCVLVRTIWPRLFRAKVSHAHTEGRKHVNGEEMLYLGAALLGALLIGSQVIRILGEPSSFSQTFDNIFHLNAVKYILDTADASSLTISTMTSAGGQPAFYPAAWHGYVSLVVQTAQVPLTIGVNAANLMISAVMWPLGCLFAVRQLARLVSITIVAAGILVGSFAAFPLFLLDFGVLYPNLLSFAMVPGALATVAIVGRVAPRPTLGPHRGVALILFFGPALALSQPNGLMTLLLLSLPVMIASFVRNIIWLRSRQSGWTAYALSVGVLVGLLTVSAVAWKLIRPPEETYFWSRIETSAQAFGEAILNAPSGRPAAWFVSVLTIAGLAYCARRKTLLWLPASFLLTVLVFVVAAGFESGDLRNFITGIWYTDPYRLSATLPLTAAILAILGLDYILRQILTTDRIKAFVLATQSRRHAITGQFVAGALLLIVMLPLTQTRSIDAAIMSAERGYDVSEESALVSTDELQVIRQLDSLTPEDAKIAVNPWTGAALAYALGDRETTYRHIFAESNPALAQIDQHLKDADSVPGVCEAVEITGVEYVLDFGDREVHGGDHSYPGIENLETSEDFEKLLEIGDAALYEFTGC